MSRNSEVARILYEIGELYAVKGESFRSRAYLVAAQRIEGLPDDLRTVSNQGSLEKIPGVGKGIAAVIVDILQTGSSSHLEELRESLPRGIQELITLEGLGPKTVTSLMQELNIASVDDLEKAARSGKIQRLKGFGVKSEENILKAIESKKTVQTRFLLGEILPIIREIEDHMTRCKEVLRVEAAGSARRMKETVGDLDILVAANHNQPVVDQFVSLPRVTRVLAKGSTRSTIIVGGRMQVDLRVVPPESYGSALQYFTGSKEHNVKLRALSVKLGYKLNEYGLFERENQKLVAGDTEESIYHACGLSYIEPELREDRGEIQAALERSLPKLVGYDEMKGDLHVHSNWSDGTATLEEIAAAAQKQKLDYVAITDHSKALAIARGLDEKRLRNQIREIDKLNKSLDEFTLLKGIEVDIKRDGSLDLPDNVLKDLDFVVASIHSGFKGTAEEISKRVISAIHNEYVSTIAHPTGRLMLRRPPYALNIDDIFQAAAEQRVMMEINAFPNRLDLNDVHSRAAMQSGVRISIGTDAHTIDQLKYLALGVSVARRGWLESKNVINTSGIDELEKKLKR
jgi:DNA polymerase (family 10)